MDLAKGNIHNLTDLWQLVNRSADSHVVGDIFDYGTIHYSDWPNRLWFHNPPDQKHLDQAKKIISTSTTRITVPFWDIDGNDYDKLLEQNNFSKVLEQLGMFLDMRKRDFKPSDITLKKVQDERSALQWELLFEKAFNYRIDHQLLLNTCEEVDYLIAYEQNKAVGTAVMFKSDTELMGIHSMGVIPEMRRQGIAEKMMHSMLSDTAKKGYRYTTLQASAMGKGLYLKLGFEEQFQMANYVLTNDINQ